MILDITDKLLAHLDSLTFLLISEQLRHHLADIAIKMPVLVNLIVYCPHWLWVYVPSFKDFIIL